MRDNRRFKKGSGCYTCSSCGKRTRSTGRGDNENVRLCAGCYDEAGLENEHQDGYHKDKPDPNCPMCKMPLINSHASAVKQDKQLREQMKWLKDNGFKTRKEAMDAGY